jgi:hypothetical protein
MTPIDSTPTAPPAQPVIPLGFASKLGVYSAAVLAIAALVTAVLNGDHSAETLTALAGAVITLATTLAGRFAQAYAIYRDSPSLGSLVQGVEVMNRPLEPGPDPTVPPGLR